VKKKADSYGRHAGRYGTPCTSTDGKRQGGLTRDEEAWGVSCNGKFLGREPRETLCRDGGQSATSTKTQGVRDSEA
jgi:hypothetical protein